MYSLLPELAGARIILASGSKQRAEILKLTGLPFEVLKTDFEENLDKTKYSINEFVELTAAGKVEKACKLLKDDIPFPTMIIGVDTMMVCRGQMYGKPADENDSFNMLKLMTTEKEHSMVSGVVLWYRGKTSRFTETTKVFMDKLTDEQIKEYIKTKEPMGKAGSYAIQGVASLFVNRIEGDYYNVMGLPICRLRNELFKLIHSYS